MICLLSFARHSGFALRATAPESEGCAVLWCLLDVVHARVTGVLGGLLTVTAFLEAWGGCSLLQEASCLSGALSVGAALDEGHLFVPLLQIPETVI